MVFCLASTVLDTEGRLSVVNFSQLQLFSFSELLQVLWQCSHVRVAFWRSVGTFLPFIIIFFKFWNQQSLTPSCPTLAPEFLTSPQRQLFGNFLSQWRINLEAFSPLLDQREYYVPWTERFEYHHYHTGSI